MKLNVDFSALHVCADRMTGIPGDQRETVVCPKCDGWGTLWEGGLSLNPEIDNATVCPECEGEGEV